jgi:hypothetical protein
MAWLTGFRRDLKYRQKTVRNLPMTMRPFKVWLDVVLWSYIRCVGSILDAIIKIIVISNSMDCR